MLDLSGIKIYIFHYKNGSVLKTDRIYQPIMAGNERLSSQTDIPGDDTGMNISEKNRYFSELSGIYWIWKNTTQDIAGSCHYRRFFTAKSYPFFHWMKQFLFSTIGLQKKKEGLIYTNNYQLFVNRIVNEDEIREIMIEYDVILPVSRKFKYSIKEHYGRYHNETDLPLVRNIISEKYPDYISGFDDVLKLNELYANNMFVMKQIDFDKFMSWWFDILFEFEKRVELSNYKGYQERVLGFLAERLLTVWFKHQNLKIKELPVIYFRNLKKDQPSEVNRK